MSEPAWGKPGKSSGWRDERFHSGTREDPYGERPRGKTNYDTLNGGPEIPSINGAQKKGDDGFHDPYQKPPEGFADWHEVGQSNMGSIRAAELRQDALESAGYKYNKRNGTWTSPDGRSTTLFGADSGPPGGVDYHWDSPGANSERQQMMDAYADDPRNIDDDQEGETGVTGLAHWAANQSIWGRFLKLFGR